MCFYASLSFGVVSRLLNVSTVWFSLHAVLQCHPFQTEETRSSFRWQIHDLSKTGRGANLIIIKFPHNMHGNEKENLAQRRGLVSLAPPIWSYVSLTTDHTIITRRCRSWLQNFLFFNRWELFGNKILIVTFTCRQYRSITNHHMKFYWFFIDFLQYN